MVLEPAGGVGDGFSPECRLQRDHGLPAATPASGTAPAARRRAPAPPLDPPTPRSSSCQADTPPIAAPDPGGSRCGRSPPGMLRTGASLETKADAVQSVSAAPTSTEWEQW